MCAIKRSVLQISTGLPGYICKHVFYTAERKLSQFVLYSHIATMGCCASKNREEPYMGTSVNERDPFRTLFELHKGICKVGTGSGSGTGFLCKFSVPDHEGYIMGFVTTSYILDVRDLSNPFMLTVDVVRGGKNSTYEITIDPSDRFRFSCAVLDTTFVHLRSEEVENLQASGRQFQELDTSWIGKKGEEVLIVQQQVGMKSRFTNGTFVRDHGVYILHTSKAKIGSWGSPLALKDGRIIGLHKRRATHKSDDTDVAVSAKVIVAAIAKHCKGASLPMKLISNPIRFDEASEARILEHDLTRCADKDNRVLIFVTPERELQVDAETGHTSHVSPVWFVPTNHGWYWTPTDPFDRTQETNWISIDTPEATGDRRQNKKTICREDRQIAKWLKSTGSIQNTKIMN